MDCKLEIVVDPAWSEAVTNRLFEIGLRGVELVEGSEECTLRTYCDSKESAEQYAEQMREYLESLADLWPGIHDYKVTVEALENQDWSNAWKSYFKPVHITPMLVVRPSWEEYSPKPNEKVVLIDPKMAFGTGTHETTVLALHAIDRLTAGSLSVGWCLLDVGCGSGILSIAAVVQGFAMAVGLDIDPAAIACAGENAELNGVSDRCIFIAAEPSQVKGNFPAVIANIDSDTLIKMAPDLVRLMKPGAILILTGIVDARRDEVLEAFKTHNLKWFREFKQGPWVLMELAAEDE